MIEHTAKNFKLCHTVNMEELIVKTTNLKEIVDITPRISELIKAHKVTSGLCHLFLTHTTAALTTSTLDLESEVDLIGAFELVIPHNTLPGESQSLFHTHHHTHLSSHIISSLIGSSLVVPVVNNTLKLGSLQRIILVELNGPRERTILIDLS